MYLQAIIFLHQLSILKSIWKTQFLGFMNIHIPCFINIHPFEDGNGRICRLILAHVLIQIKCCLFPVILSSFHRRGRRHYIRALKTFNRKPSMLYTMIAKSLIHCWNNFEQNARMLARCWRLILYLLSRHKYFFDQQELWKKNVFCHAIFL